MYYNNRFIELSVKDEEFDDSKNIIIYDHVTYILRPLNKDYPTSKGGNSSVFELIEANDGKKIRAIKISNYYKPSRSTNQEIKRRFGRFITEIDILSKAKEAGLKNIIEIDFNGVLELNGRFFPYYTMERADLDLKEFVNSNSYELDEQEKVKFCSEIFNSIKELFGIDYYHRDIKPDNIFLFSTTNEEGVPTKLNWKIGDLGLARHRSSDLDKTGEKIGPLGWLSPEAMNKHLTEKAGKGFDCLIDEKSDIFQLGKIFWFIFMGNCPIGELYYKDFTCNIKHKRKIWAILIAMMSSIKSRRPSINDLEIKILKISERFGL